VQAALARGRRVLTMRYESESVRQLDKDEGNLLVVHASVSDAARAIATDKGDATNSYASIRKHASAIQAALSGRTGSAHGFCWEHADAGKRDAARLVRTEKLANAKPARNTSVVKLDLGTGEVVGRPYASQAEAATVLGIKQSSIGKCVRGHAVSAGGFGWRATAPQPEI
jgi:hypothetical protein